MDWKALCELLPQPVFLVREETVRWCNSACFGLVAEGMALRDLTEDGGKLFSLRAQGQTMQLPILLGSTTPAQANVSHTDEGDLFIVSTANTHGDFAATALGTSVCLRRPVNSAVMASRRLFAMLEDYDDPMMMQEAAELNRALYQLMRFCGQLTDGALLLRHRQIVHREMTDISAFLRRFGRDADALLHGSGRTLTLRLPDKPIRGVIDAALIERALYNLLSNALRFTPRGGTIEISAEVSDRDLLVRVCDNGEGFSPSVLAALFEQRDEPSPDPRRGVGLGLPMVREIVRLHDGTMSVASNPEGRGACVTFTLSLRPGVMQLRSRRPVVDYCGTFNHGLVELSDALDAECYDPRDVR